MKCEPQSKERTAERYFITKRKSFISKYPDNSKESRNKAEKSKLNLSPHKAVFSNP